MFCKSQEACQVSSGARSRKSRFMRYAAAPEKVQRRRFLEGGHEPQVEVRRGPGSGRCQHRHLHHPSGEQVSLFAGPRRPAVG